MNFIRLLADQGVAPAQYNLGVCCYDGYGIIKNLTQAFIWFQNAAEESHTGAQQALEVLKREQI